MWAPEPAVEAKTMPVRPKTAAVVHEHELRVRPYVVGYSGYIPGLMFQYGRTFAKAAEDCVVTFLKQQETRTVTTGVEIERRCKSLPRMRSVRTTEGAKQQTFVFANDERYPPLPGYTGHISYVVRSSVVGRSVASATRRERERSAVHDGIRNRTNEKSLERYQEQTASSRAKQVKTVSKTIQSNEVSFSKTQETEVVGVTNNSTEKSVASQQDTVKSVLAGQIRCDDCEKAQISAEQFTEIKIRSSSAESQRKSSTFSSSIHKSASMNVSQRSASASSRQTNLTKNVSPSKHRGKLLTRSKSGEKSSTRTSSTDAKIRTTTTQTSYQKNTNPSMKTQTSVQPIEEAVENTAQTTKSTVGSPQKKISSPAKKISSSSKTVKIIEPKDHIVGKGDISSSKDQSKSFPNTQEQAKSTSNPIDQKESLSKTVTKGESINPTEESSISISKKNPKFESHLNLTSNTGKEAQVI